MSDVLLTSDIVELEDARFDINIPLIRQHIKNILLTTSHLFKTDIDPDLLWDMYIQSIESIAGADVARRLNCHVCKSFIRKFGPIVKIEEDGELTPILWSWTSNDDGPLSTTFKLINNHMKNAKITSLWTSDLAEIGMSSNVSKTTGVTWTHLSATLPPHLYVHGVTLYSADQLMAKSRQRFSTLMNNETGIHRIKLSTFETAVKLFESHSLNRSDQFVDVARFHANSKKAIVGSRRVGNQIWRELMSRPEGWENVNSTAIGKLYSWIESSWTLESIKHTWNTMVSGDNYQRPTELPSEGTIAQAEEVIAKLGLESALERRYARLEEIRCLWKPKEGVVAARETKGGIFSSLKAKNSNHNTPVVYNVDPKHITWERFAEKIMIDADKIEFLTVPMGNYAGMTTAEHADSRPILKWDKMEDRYPISGYLYAKGSSPAVWSLPVTSFVNVTGIARLPGHEETYVIILEGAVDKHLEKGLGLFPETLINELHGVRSVIEAFSAERSLSGKEEASACGYQIGRNNCAMRLRVTVGDDVRDYVVDRFD
jgi:hypothetical protein